MRHSWDWDAHTIYKMLYFKLDRLYNEMTSNGHCMWNANPNTNLMKKLREARELAKRLDEDRYDMAGFYETEERYGELIREEESYGKYTSIKLYWKDDKAATKYRDRRDKYWQNVKLTERKRLHYLLEHYTQIWWD